MFQFLISFFESPRFDPLADNLASFVIHEGFIAPFILLLIEEAGVPLPIPGDVYVAFAGYQVSLHRMTYFEAFFFLVASVLIGSTILYYISAKWGKILVLKIGKYIHADQKKITQVQRSFKKYGILVIIFGRHIPGLRVPITIFSGISGVPYRTFILSTFISVIFWIAFYLTIGERLGKGVMHHLHNNHMFYILFLIPYIIFIGSIIYIKIKQKLHAKKRR